MKETPLRFGRDGALVGILTEPADAAGAQAGARSGGQRSGGLPGVIFPNAGLVHHVGVNRLHVTLARTLAAKGIPSLRFDLSGIGDSPPSRDTRAVGERRIVETREAMQALGDATGTDRFLLFGHCSGAQISFTTAWSDTRVVGLGLLNPPGRLMARHFVRTFLRHPAAWRRLFAGEATIARQVRRFLREARGTGVPKQKGARRPDVVGGLRKLVGRGVNVLIIYSEWDTGLDYFDYALRRAIRAPELKEKIRFDMVPGADHNLSLVAHQNRVIEIFDEWTTHVGDVR